MTRKQRRPNPDVEARRDRVTELTHAGLTAGQIATRLRTTQRTVVRDRVARGCAQPKAPQLTDDEIRLAAQLLDDGCPYNEVARTLGRATSAIQKRLPGRGWQPSEGAAFRYTKTQQKADR